METLTTIIQSLTIYKDIITIFAAVTAAIASLITVIIAMKGLKAWREQLKGVEKYKTGKKLLTILYKARDILTKERLGKPTDTYEKKKERNDFAGIAISELEEEYMSIINEVEFNFGHIIKEKGNTVLDKIFEIHRKIAEVLKIKDTYEITQMTEQRILTEMTNDDKLYVDLSKMIEELKKEVKNKIYQID